MRGVRREGEGWVEGGAKTRAREREKDRQGGRNVEEDEERRRGRHGTEGGL